VIIRLPSDGLVLLVGASSSGKSSFARRHFAPAEVVSSDACRVLVAGDERAMDANEGVFALLHDIVRERLRRGSLTVVDATNLQVRARRPLLELARRFGRPAVAIVFDVGAEPCRQRNRERPDRRLPDSVIRRQLGQLRHSLATLGGEGFQETVVLGSADEVQAAVVERSPAEMAEVDGQVAVGAPALPRQSATVLLLRDAGGIEVFMLRRPPRSSFGPSAYVFPGGAVDAADGDTAALALAPGWDRAAVAPRMRLDGDPASLRLCAALHLCAVREAFEEAGVLIGRRPGGAPLDGAAMTALEPARRHLLAGESLVGVLRAAGVRLALDELRYIAHFITPASEPVRFDTRFFAVRSPADQEPAAHPGEAVHGAWWAPAALLERHGGDRGALMPPTRILLAELAEHRSVDEALDDLGSRPVAGVLFSPEALHSGRLPERLPAVDGVW